MNRIISLMIAFCLLGLATTPAMAQQTTGTITGRILDDQGAAVPGATVTGKNALTGFVRTDVSDGEGVFRLTAMPVGTYDLTAELQGFTKVENKGIVLSVGQTLDVNFALKLATVQETITVTGESPLIETSSSSVGGVVDVGRLESLPLNGRQFANAAVTIPGVGLGYHSDPTKSTQVLAADCRRQRPQRQLPDRRRRQQRRHRRRPAPALPARSGRAVQLRDVALQGGVRPQQRRRDEHRHEERHEQPARQLLHALPRRRAQLADRDGKARGRPTSRTTSGGSTADRSAGRSCRTRCTTSSPRSSARSRTRSRSSTRTGLFPDRGWRLRHAVSREPAHGQSHGADDAHAVPGGPLRPEHELAAVRRGSRYAAERMGREREHVQLDQPEPQLGARRLEAERIHLPVCGLRQRHHGQQPRSAASRSPTASPSARTPNTPQQTQQQKYQFRDDFSWSIAGMGGLGHDIKTGVNFIKQPRLFITFNTGTGDYAYSC